MCHASRKLNTLSTVTNSHVDTMMREPSKKVQTNQHFVIEKHERLMDTPTRTSNELKNCDHECDVNHKISKNNHAVLSHE